MNKYIVASTVRSAGKTSVIVGLAKALPGDEAYVKPLGDRLVYRKKRLWDYDTALIAGIFGLRSKPEDITIGFEHAKLRYMYDQAKTREKVLEIVDEAGRGKTMMFIEAGCDFSYGASIHLDPISLARYVDGKLLLVVAGPEYEIIDQIIFMKRNIELSQVNFAGVIINKVLDVEDFQRSHLPELTAAGVKVLGVIPYQKELTHLSVSLVVDRLFAKVLTGEVGLNKEVENIFLGAMSVNSVIQSPLWQKENKLIITSGDRSDMIIAALESDTSCIVLTNNILPPSNVISMAAHANIPLLLVPWDTFSTVKQFDAIEPLLTKEDTAKIKIIADMVRQNLDVSGL